jgi:hypothetical protein
LIFKSDFEISSLKAIKNVFLFSRISGCQFHLEQNIFRRIQKLGLQNIYNVDTNVRRFTKALTALSYVRVSEILNTFISIKSSQTILPV